MYNNRIMKLPENIEKLTSGKIFTADDIGMSLSKVLICDDLVLKITDLTTARSSDDDTVKIMRWLYGKLPVPEVLAYEKDEKFSYLLMTRIKGEMSCSAYYLDHPEELVDILVSALKMMWSVNISDCPREISLDDDLLKKKARVEKDLVSTDNAEPDTYGEGGFKDPTELLAWLSENKPPLEPCLSHGDFCLPNIFVYDGKVSGFIDLGDTGVADKWRDIALCYRSLKHNFDGTYSGIVHEGFEPEMFFDALGLEPDWDKIRYYILLDELN